jgi:heat shock protein beta
VSEEVEDNEEKIPEDTENPETKVEDEEEGSKKEKKTKTITKTIWDWDLVNDIKAIWMRDKTEITDREYNDFYKTISKDN